MLGVNISIQINVVLPKRRRFRFHSVWVYLNSDCVSLSGRKKVCKMADGGFDPCECIWNHENAMQRLMNLVGSGARSMLNLDEKYQDPKVGCDLDVYRRN